MNDNVYDVIIVGSGPAGLTAAIYTTRANLKTLVIAGAKWGGQLMLTTVVENYPGFPDSIQGPDLMAAMRKQAERHGAAFINADMDPTDFSNQSGGPFTVTVEGKQYQGKAILIASGADAKTLEVPGEKELTGRGISYCATCDGAFFRGKDIIVVGGGDSAMEEAIFLTHFANHVTIVHRRNICDKASQILYNRAKNNPKITFLYNSQIVEVIGQGKVEKVKVQNIETKEITEMPIDGVFVAIGHTPNTKVFKGVALREGGYVRVQDGTRTNIEGIFVSGDVEDDRYQQAVTAAGFGCMAALDIEKWIREKE